MSGTQCQEYHIYEILWVLWMIFKVLGKIITYVFSLIQGKGRNLAPTVVYHAKEADTFIPLIILSLLLDIPHT